MPRRDDRYARNRDQERRSSDNYGRYHDVDPEYDARTYASSPTNDYPGNHPGGNVGGSRPLVDYDYASDDNDSHRSNNAALQRERRRSRSRSPSRKEKKESKKSKKKKKSRSKSRERDSSGKRYKSRQSVSPGAIDSQIPPPAEDYGRRRNSPPKQYAQNSPHRPPASPPRAYQSGRSRLDGEEERMRRSRSPVNRNASPGSSRYVVSSIY